MDPSFHGNQGRLFQAVSAGWGWAGALRVELRLSAPWAQAWVGGPCEGAMTYRGAHRGPSAGPFPRLLMKEDEGPTAALGRGRGRIAVVCGEGMLDLFPPPASD